MLIQNTAIFSLKDVALFTNVDMKSPSGDFFAVLQRAEKSFAEAPGNDVPEKKDNIKTVRNEFVERSEASKAEKNEDTEGDGDMAALDDKIKDTHIEKSVPDLALSVEPEALETGEMDIPLNVKEAVFHEAAVDEKAASKGESKDLDGKTISAALKTADKKDRDLKETAKETAKEMINGKDETETETRLAGVIEKNAELVKTSGEKALEKNTGKIRGEELGEGVLEKDGSVPRKTGDAVRHTMKTDRRVETADGKDIKSGVREAADKTVSLDAFGGSRRVQVERVKNSDRKGRTQKKEVNPPPQTISANAVLTSPGQAEKSLQEEVKSENASVGRFLEGTESIDTTTGIELGHQTGGRYDRDGGSLSAKSNQNGQSNIQRFLNEQNLESRDVFRTLVRNAKLRLSDQRQEALIQLKPEKLGRIKLKITVEDGVITGKIIAETNEARELLDMGFQDLKEEFERSGITVDSFDISTGGEREFFEDFNQNLQEPETVFSSSRGKETENAPAEFAANERKMSLYNFDVRV